MAINYNDVRSIIDQQYKDRKQSDGTLSLNSLYYDFFKIDVNTIINDNLITTGITKMLGHKTEREKQQEIKDLQNLENNYPITYNKVRYKYYGK